MGIRFIGNAKPMPLDSSEKADFVQANNALHNAIRALVTKNSKGLNGSIYATKTPKGLEGSIWATKETSVPAPKNRKGLESSIHAVTNTLAMIPPARSLLDWQEPDA